jgi:nucleoside-diphosphate-sugar epimerase
VKLLVVGGTGVLGHRVVRLLASAGHDVQATARDSDGATAVTAVGARALDLDVYDAVAVRQAVRGKDAVLRLTTKVPPLQRMRASDAWTETGRLRIESARLFADACVTESVAVYVHESIAFVYADGGEAWLEEDAAVDVAAAAALRDALAGEANADLVTAAGARGVVLRFAGFYAHDSAQSIELAAMLQRRRMALIGPSRNFCSSIHADDAATATVAAITVPAGVYNVGDDRPVPWRDNIASLARALDAPPMRRRPRFMGRSVMGEAWSYLSRSQRVSARRLREATGWSPTVKDVLSGWNLVATQWAAETQRRV